jgi:hypothetical protein
VLRPVSCILSALGCVLCSTRSVLCPVSYPLCTVSCILCPARSLLCSASYVLYSASYILRALYAILYPVRALMYPVSYSCGTLGPARTRAPAELPPPAEIAARSLIVRPRTPSLFYSNHNSYDFPLCTDRADGRRDVDVPVSRPSRHGRERISASVK